MSDPHQHVSELERIRIGLVNERRDAARRSEVNLVIRMQEQIEAVDRAIVDENKLIPFSVDSISML